MVMDAITKFTVFLCVCSIVICQDVPYDCQQPPPPGVEPLNCCKVSQPFNADNFPDCFADDAITDAGFDNVRVTRDENDNEQPNNEREPSGGFRSHGRHGNAHHWGGHQHHHGWNSHEHRFGNGNDNKRGSRNENTPKRSKTNSIKSQTPIPSRPQTPIPNNCAIECIFNQTKVVSNDKLDRDAALVIYAKYYTELPEDLIVSTIVKCAQQVQNWQDRSLNRRRNGVITNQINRNVNNRRQCRNVSGLFAACFNRVIYANCPDNITENSNDCNELKEFIDNCSPIRGVRNVGDIDGIIIDDDGNILPDVTVI